MTVRSPTTTTAMRGGCSSTCARPRSGLPSPERCRLRRQSTGTPTWSAGLPWFDYYDADARDLAASETLAKVKSVGQKLGAQERSVRARRPQDGDRPRRRQSRRRHRRVRGSRGVSVSRRPSQLSDPEHERVRRACDLAGAQLDADET